MELAETYVYAIYQTRNFSKAAQMLYITQSSLSSTVKKLENKLGFTIFDRSKSPITMTPEGLIYIEYLSEKLENEENLKKRIKLLQTSTFDKLYIGSTCLLAHRLFPKVCGLFHKKFPNVEITLNMGEGFFHSTLYDQLDSGLLNLVFSYSCDKYRFDSISVFEERYVVAARKDLLKTEKLIPYALSRNEVLSKKQFPQKEISDFSLFKDVEFLRASKGGMIQSDMSYFLSECTFSNCYVHNTRKNDIAYEMMSEGLGAVVTTDYVISLFPERDDIYYFLLSPQKTRQAMFVFKKNVPLSKSAEEFIDITQNIINKREIF